MFTVTPCFHTALCMQVDRQVNSFLRDPPRAPTSLQNSSVLFLFFQSTIYASRVMKYSRLQTNRVQSATGCKQTNELAN